MVTPCKLGWQYLGKYALSRRSITTSTRMLMPRQGTRGSFKKLLEQQDKQKVSLKQSVVEPPAETRPLTPSDFTDIPTEELIKNTNLGHNHAAPEFPSDEAAKTLRNEANNRARDQTRHSWRPKVNPEDTSIMLFPGQGSQFVGMGRDLLQYSGVEQMFAVASDVLGYDLLELCLNGPIEELSRTEYLQPAILVTSLAAVEKLKALHPEAILNCVGAAGFSVGEYAALVFGGSMSFEDAVNVVKVRAQAMQQASEEVPSGMMTVFLHASAKLKMACHTAVQYCQKRLDIEQATCTVANYLYPECKVIAGNKEALDFIQVNKKDFGIKRVKWLPVSGAFHSYLMRPAIKPLHEALANTEMRVPIIPVHSNVTSHKYGSVKAMKKMLVSQITQPVKWEQTMHVLYARRKSSGFPFTYELGPGSQLGNILKMVNQSAYEQCKSIKV